MKKCIRILLLLCLIFSLVTSMSACQSKGDKGDTGATGPKGIQGPKGDQGDPGSSAVIDIIVNESSGNGAWLVAPVLVNGIPIIRNGYRVHIYGAGFVVGETITFTIADGRGSIDIGTTTLMNSAGVFVWDTWANWPSYHWSDSGTYYGSIKAIGNKGSTAVSFVNIGPK